MGEAEPDGPGTQTTGGAAASGGPAAGGGAATTDEQRLAEYSTGLADDIEAALPGWIVRSIRTRVESAGRPFDERLSSQASAAGARCRAEVGPRVRALLANDLADQRTTPLALLRSATSYATEVLRAAGVPPVTRDEFDQRAFPSDVYSLSPASFADVDESLGEPGLIWGAAKAHVHLARRRRSEGSR